MYHGSRDLLEFSNRFCDIKSQVYIEVLKLHLNELSSLKTAKFGFIKGDK